MICSVAHRSEQPNHAGFPPLEPTRGRARNADPRGAPPYLAGLNPEQLCAVELLEGAVLVLAGAGVGKNSGPNISHRPSDRVGTGARP